MKKVLQIDLNFFGPAKMEESQPSESPSPLILSFFFLHGFLVIVAGVICVCFFLFSIDFF